MTAREAVEACAALNERLAKDYARDAELTGDPSLSLTCIAQAYALRAAAIQMRATVAVTP